MRAHAVGSLAVGVLLLSSSLASQVPLGTPMPGPVGPRMQIPPRDAATTHPATGTGRIQGRVLAADTGMPLRRAQIRIFANEQRVNRMASTDADGRYELRDLPAGRYNLTVTRNGYVSLQFGQQRPFEPGKPSLVLAETTKGKGVSFMENQASWHHRVPTDEEFALAIAELETAESRLQAS